MRSFPFPNRIFSREELKRDVLYAKIPEDERDTVCDKAWNTGVKAAVDIFEKFGNDSDIFEIIKRYNLIIRHEDIDRVIGGMRYFSEYITNRNEIILYDRSVAKWAEENGFKIRQAEEIILSHEFFHFLEASEIGLTSRQYSVPTLKLGPFVLVKSSVKALSEIGAHGFSRTYFEIHKDLHFDDDAAKYTLNATIDITNFQKAASIENLKKSLGNMMNFGKK